MTETTQRCNLAPRVRVTQEGGVSTSELSPADGGHGAANVAREAGRGGVGLVAGDRVASVLLEVPTLTASDQNPTRPASSKAGPSQPPPLRSLGAGACPHGPMRMREGRSRIHLSPLLSPFCFLYGGSPTPQQRRPQQQLTLYWTAWQSQRPVPAAKQDVIFLAGLSLGLISGSHHGLGAAGKLDAPERPGDGKHPGGDLGGCHQEERRVCGDPEWGAVCSLGDSWEPRGL